jgi:hypothetical protein
MTVKIVVPTLGRREGKKSVMAGKTNHVFRRKGAKTQRERRKATYFGKSFSLRLCAFAPLR